MKKCPYCEQEIQDDATKCRYCGEWLVREKKEPLSLGSIKFPKMWPGYVLAVLIFLAEIIGKIGNPPNAQQSVALLPILLSLIGIIYWNICVFKIHKVALSMADNCYPIPPARAVGFGFIPIYNFYWMFKWPNELINFIRTRSDVKTIKPWLIGLLFLLSGIISRVSGAIWVLVDFGALAYLVNVLKKSLSVRPEPVPYKSKPGSLSTVAIVFACVLPVIFIIGLLAAIAIPNFIVARETAQANYCAANLKQIQTAKVLWSNDTGAANDATPNWNDLVPQYIIKIPTCPKDGSYIIGSIDSAPTCSVGDNNTQVARDDHVFKK